MKKRHLLAYLGLLLLLGSFVVLFVVPRDNREAGTPATSAFKVGIVNVAPTLVPVREGIRAGLAERGYEEGVHIEYSVSDLVSTVEEATRVIHNFIADDVDLIIALGSEPSRAAQALTRSMRQPTPVFIVVSDPVGARLVTSLSEPGANITGVTPGNETIGGRRVDLLHQLIPAVKRIVYPYSNPSTAGVTEITRTANTLGIELISTQVQSVEEMETFLSTFDFKDGDSFLRATDSVAAKKLDRIVEVTRAHNIPLIGSNGGDIPRGAVMTYGSNYFDLGVQGARLIDKLLRGNLDPGKLPVELPEQFELVVNLDVAKAINLSITDAFLQQANRVVKTEE